MTLKERIIVRFKGLKKSRIAISILDFLSPLKQTIIRTFLVSLVFINGIRRYLVHLLSFVILAYIFTLFITETKVFTGLRKYWKIWINFNLKNNWIGFFSAMIGFLGISLKKSPIGHSFQYPF